MGGHSREAPNAGGRGSPSSTCRLEARPCRSDWAAAALAIALTGATCPALPAILGQQGKPPTLTADALFARKKYAEAAAIYQKLAGSPTASPEIIKKAAVAYELAGNTSQAEATYSAYLNLTPDDLEARASLGRLYSLGGKYGKAEAEFRRVLSVDSKSSPALTGLARALACQGQTSEALELYDRALRFDPKNGEALTGKALTLLWTGRAKQAAALFAQLHGRYPKDVEVARGLAQADAALEEVAVEATRQPNDLVRTEDYYRHRLAKNPTDLAALKALAQLTATPKSCAESIKFGRKAVDVAPGDPVYELTLARALAPCQQYSEAIARYRRFLLFHPQAEDALLELGDALLRARRYEDAATTFRALLHLDPKNIDATLNLARALAALRNYPEALMRYDQVLQASPDNYDALQGKAYILYYTGQYAQARLIFQNLAAKQPSDTDNTEALANIARAESGARQASEHPAPDAPPQEFVVYYEKRLASDPNDVRAVQGLASVEAQLKNTRAAIQAYRRVLEIQPDDRDAKLELARQLNLDRQHDASVKLYQEILKTAPNDSDALEGLARVYGWQGRDRGALKVYQNLAARNPSNAGYRLEVARLELRLKDYAAAREVLASVLSSDPQNREARLLLAQLDLVERRLADSVTDYDYVLRQNPRDVNALFGKAQALYYQGKILPARAVASELVQEHPDNFDALFLLASIEHAGGRRREALARLTQADRLSPNNPEVVEMRGRLAEEARVTLTTSASYAREIGAPEVFKAAAGLPNEDLRVYSYGTEAEFSPVRAIQSSLRLSFVPTASPPGPLRDAQGNQIPTTLTGATVPWVLFSQNTWQASERFTVRGGVGVIRFGPGKLENLLGQTVPSNSATASPLAYIGVSFAPVKKFSLDLNLAREAVTDSPPAIRFGVMESRGGGGLNFIFSSRSELHLTAYHGDYASIPYNHASVVNGQQVIQKRADHDRGTSGTVLFTESLFHSSRFSFDGGYSAVAFGFAGLSRQTYLGYYNPSFYQRHLVTARFYGKLLGPVSYDFTGGIGLQQSLQGQALTRALNLYPSFTLKVSPHLSITAGFIHYNTALALGPLRGNEVRLSTTTKF